MQYLYSGKQLLPKYIHSHLARSSEYFLSPTTPKIPQPNHPVTLTPRPTHHVRKGHSGKLMQL